MTQKDLAKWPNEALDDDGYPTEEALQFIENYDIAQDSPEGLIKFIEEIWYHGDWGFIQDGDKLELHTGGWSGNEDVIRSLQKTFFWTFFWESSRRGGHYYFDGLDKFKK